MPTEPRRTASAEPPSPGRRRFLFAAGSAGLCAVPGLASATQRTPSGGTLRLSLPCATSALDPHDPHDLSAALLGESLFEPLYQTLPDGRTYPTLADSLPERRGRSLAVDLRPELRCGDGSPLDARTAAAALRRAQQRQPDLLRLGTIDSEKSQLTFRTVLTPEELASLLARPGAAIVSRTFTPDRPGGTGALRCRGAGVAQLVRNPWAPRGGAYLDQVEIQSDDLRAGLRAFEAGRSHVGLLGAGLYQTGVEGQALALGAVGKVVLLAGAGLGRFGAPGVLSEELSRTPVEGLRALGVRPFAQATPGSYRGPRLHLDVDGSHPWLRAIAEELARVWTSPRAPVACRFRQAAELAEDRKSGNFGAQLLFLRRDDPLALHAGLYALEGEPAPRNLPALDLAWSARRLRLGILGDLEARGTVAPGLTGLGSKGRFALEQTFFAPSFD